MVVLAKYRILYLMVALWRMARPMQLFAFFVLYTTGVFVGMKDGYGISLMRFIIGLVPLLIAGASIHYSNEYADIETDKLTQRTPFSGGSGVLTEGKVSQRVAELGMWILLVCALLLSVVSLFLGMLTLIAFIILLLGLFFGWMYSLPPLKLGWRGWGELDNALLGGTLLIVYGYAVVADTVMPEIVLMCLPFTGMVFINLLATTWADREADRAVGKNTLATQLSIPTLRRLYAFVAFVSYALLIVLADRIIPMEIVVGALLISPTVLWGYMRYTKIQSPHPTVYTMIAMMIVYFVGWLWQLMQ
jgi:1,4-dihydroxy-2-naphthoate polyprenyltransferase